MLVAPGLRRSEIGVGGPRFARPSAFLLSACVAALWAVYQNLWRFRFPTVASDEPTYAIAGWRYIHGGLGSPPSYAAPANSDNFEHPPLAKYLYGLAESTVGHVSVPADRIVSGCCVVVTALIVAMWIGYAADRWVGLGAGLLVAVLPMHVADVDFRVARYAMLDPVAELFMVASVAAAWLWFRRDGLSAWLWAIATGGLTGLAAASKENGFLGVVGPVLLGLMLAVACRNNLATTLLAIGRAAVAVVVSGLVFLATYLPLPHPRASLQYLLGFQSHQSSLGHMVGFAGRVTAHPPWWTFLWFAGHGLGSVVTVASLACCAIALISRRDRLVAWCLAALVGPLVFHMFIAGVVLAYYWVLWMPAYLALVALGLGEVVRLAAKYGTAVRSLAAAAMVVAVAVFVFASVRDSVRVATRSVAGPARLPTIMREDDLHGPVIVTGLASWQFWGVDVGRVSFSMPASLDGYDTVILAAGGCRHDVDQATRALVAANTAEGRLRNVYRDRTMVVYAALSMLQSPTPSEIAAQPPTDPAAGC